MSDAEIRERQRRVAVTGDVEDRARVYADKLRTAGPCVACAPTENMHRDELWHCWRRRFLKGEKWPRKPAMGRIQTVYTDGTRRDSAPLLYLFRAPRLRRVGVTHYEVVLHDIDRINCRACAGRGSVVLMDLVNLARLGDEAAVAVVGPQPPVPGQDLVRYTLDAAARRRLGG